MVQQNVARWLLLAMVLGVFGSAVSFACTSEYPGDDVDAAAPTDASAHTPRDVLGTGP